jgi:hypothetical protein
LNFSFAIIASQEFSVKKSILSEIHVKKSILSEIHVKKSLGRVRLPWPALCKNLGGLGRPPLLQGFINDMCVRMCFIICGFYISINILIYLKFNEEN